jgi:hypothetical protein
MGSKCVCGQGGAVSRAQEIYMVVSTKDATARDAAAAQLSCLSYRTGGEPEP